MWVAVNHPKRTVIFFPLNEVLLLHEECQCHGVLRRRERGGIQKRLLSGYRVVWIKLVVIFFNKFIHFVGLGGIIRLHSSSKQTITEENCESLPHIPLLSERSCRLSKDARILVALLGKVQLCHCRRRLPCWQSRYVLGILQHHML